MSLVSYGYSTAGRRLAMTNTAGVHRYIYDPLGRLCTNTTPVGTLYYQYDAGGNLTSLSSATANGVSINYQYDALSRLINVIDNRLSGPKNTGYTFDGVGNLQTLQYPNGTTNHWQYDELNRLTSLTWKQNGSQRGDFNYQLAVTGHRTSLSDNVNGTSRTFTWQYDRRYRLTSETVSGGSPAGTLGYSYDLVSNRASRSGTLGSLTPQTFNYDVNDWLDNDAVANNANPYFNAAGDTTSYAGTWQYDWANRLTNANNGAVLLTYDGDGHRVKKVAGSTTTLYLVATVNPTGYAQVVEELTVSGSVTNLSKAFVVGLDLISQRQSNGTVHYYGYDGLGSVRFLLNSSGTITDTYTYDAYGTLIASTETTPNDYRYAGEQWDANLGMYYLRARYMSPGLGRFWTKDSYEGSSSDPLSLHKYLYAHGNPVNRIDPSGHMSYGELGTVMAKIGYLSARVGTSVDRAYRFARIRSTVWAVQRQEQILWAVENGEAVIGLGQLVGAVVIGGGIVLHEEGKFLLSDTLDRISKALANNSTPIPDGGTLRGGVIEQVALQQFGHEYLGGNVSDYDLNRGTANTDLMLQFRTHDFENPSGLKNAVLTDLEDLSAARHARSAGTTGGGAGYERNAGPPTVTVLSIGISEDNVGQLNSHEMQEMRRAALNRRIVLHFSTVRGFFTRRR